MALQIGYIVLAVLGLILSILPEMGDRLPAIDRFKQRLGNQGGWVMNLISLIGTLFLVIGILGFIVIRFVPSFELSSGIKFEDREYITLFGGLQLRYYGILIVVAMLIAASVATRLAKLDGRDPEHVWGILTWAIIPGIIFARLWFVTFPPRSVVVEGFDALYYWSNFFAADGAIAIWTGGLSIFGAVLGGLLGALIYLRRNHLAVPAWLDIAAVALPLGQAIGRWANYINQELYGIPTTLPWGIQIDSANRILEYKSTVEYPVSTTLFHPLFLYELLWSLVAFIVLLSLFNRNRHQLKVGTLFLYYLAQYSVIRFLLEFLRIETTFYGNINFSQVVTLIILAVSLGLLFLRRNDESIPPRSKWVDGIIQKPVTAKVITNPAPSMPEETVEAETPNEQA